MDRYMYSLFCFEAQIQYSFFSFSSIRNNSSFSQRFNILTSLCLRKKLRFVGCPEFSEHVNVSALIQAFCTRQIAADRPEFSQGADRFAGALHARTFDYVLPADHRLAFSVPVKLLACSDTDQSVKPRLQAESRVATTGV